MAEVNLGPRRFVTIEDPKQRISQAERAAPWVALGKGLDALGGGLEDIAVAQAEQDGAKAVTMDEQGNPVASSMPAIFGRTAGAYNKAAQLALFSETDRKSGVDLLNLAKEHEGKPDAFKAAAEAYRDKILAGQPGAMVEPLRRRLNDSIVQHQQGLISRQWTRDVATMNDKLDAARVLLETRMSSLAATGGTGTPEYAAAKAEYEALGRQVVGNPLLKTSAERWQVYADAQEEKDTVGALAVPAQKHFDESGDLASTLQWVREQLANPALKIDALKQARYARQIETIVRGSAAVRAEDRKAAIDGADEVRRRIAESGADTVPQAEVYDTLTTLKRVGAIGKAAQLEREYQIGRNAPLLGGRDTRAAIGALQGRTPPGGNVTPELGAAIDAASQQYGVPAAFLSRLAVIESSGGRKLVNPESSARGHFQFMPGTWAQYGAGGDRMNANDSAAAAARLTQANARVLRNALGREPTWGELYLAHQQGAGGASALLTNPGMRAADLVGADAVRLNGGTLNMSAGDFAGLWVRKFGGGAGLGSAPGVMTAPVNPGVVQQYQKLFDTGTGKLNTEVLGAGIGNATQDEYGELAERLQYVRDGDLRRRIEEHLTLAQAMGKFKGMPWDEQQRAVAEMEAALVSGELGPLGRDALKAAKPQAEAAAKAFVERTTPMVDNAASDPVTAAAAMRAAKKALKPDSVSQVQTRFDARFRALLTDFDTSTKEGKATAEEFGRLTVLAPYVADIDLGEKFKRLSIARDAKAGVAERPLAEQQQIAEQLDVALRGGAVPASLRPTKNALDNLVKGNTEAFVKQALPIVDNAAANPVLAAALMRGAAQVDPDTIKEVQTRYDARVRALANDIENPKAGKATAQEIGTLTVLAPHIGDIDLAEKVRRILTTNDAVAQQAGMPIATAQQVGGELQVRAEAGDSFPVQRALTASWNAQAAAQAKLVAGDPVTFWRNEHPTTPAPPPLNFGNPEAMKAAVLERQRIANLVRQDQKDSAVGAPIAGPDLTAMQQAIKRGDPREVGAIMAGLSVLDETNLRAVLPGLNDALLVATQHRDPAKYSAIMGTLDGLYRRNPELFNAALNDSLRTRLGDYQALTAYLTPAELTDWLKKDGDVLTQGQRDARNKEAHAEAGKVDVAAEIEKAQNGWVLDKVPFARGNVQGAVNDRLRAEYAALLETTYARTGSMDEAKKITADVISRRWSYSGTAGGIIKNAPERFYPQVAGSHGWMREQLERDVRSFLFPAPDPGGEPRDETLVGRTAARAQYGLGPQPGTPAGVPVAPLHIRVVPTIRTDAEVRAFEEAKKRGVDLPPDQRPGYQVVVKDPRTGAWTLVTGANGTPMTYRFDWRGPQMAAGAAFDTQEQNMVEFGKRLDERYQGQGDVRRYIEQRRGAP